MLNSAESKVTQVFMPMIRGSHFTNKRIPRGRRGGGRQQLIEAILKRTLVEDWPGAAVLNHKDWANWWTESSFLQIEGTWSNWFRIKDRREEETRAEPIWLIDKPVPLSTWIWSKLVYASEVKLRLCKSLVRWWVAPVFGYPLSLVGKLGEEVENLQGGLRVMRRGLIKPLIARDGIVSRLVADLTDETWGAWRMRIEILATTTCTRGGTTSAKRRTTIGTAIGKTTSSIETSTTLARITRSACSEMSRGIWDVSGSQLLLKTHLMG